MCSKSPGRSDSTVESARVNSARRASAGIGQRVSRFHRGSDSGIQNPGSVEGCCRLPLPYREATNMEQPQPSWPRSTAGRSAVPTNHKTLIELPSTGYVRLPQVIALVPFSKSTLWRQVKTGAFPKPVKLSARITAWRVEDVRRWIGSHGPEIDTT